MTPIEQRIERTLEAHSAILRSAMESHFELRKQWEQCKTRVLLDPASGEESAINLGEAHILLEMQLANQVRQSLVSPRCLCVHACFTVALVFAISH